MKPAEPMEDTLTPEERAKALDEVARRIRRYHLETPAAFFLEMHRPLAGLAGLASYAFTPLLGAFMGLDTVERYAALLGDRTALDELLGRLENAPPSLGATPEAPARPSPAPPSTFETDR